MRIHGKFFQGGAVLSVGQVFSQGLSVIRNILVARLIVTEADYGIASTLIMVVTFNDMLTNLGMNMIVVQDRDGEQIRFLNVAHTVAAIRGLVGAAMLLVLAYPLALMFHIPQAAWAFAYLSLIPLLRGISHFDIYRMQREHSFLPGVIQDTLSQVVGLIACVPFLMFFHDYSAVLYLLILQTSAAMILSHLLAKRPYRWSRDRVMENRIMAFGTPLLLNGIVFFVISQGERLALVSSGHFFVNAAEYTMEDVAAFSAAFMISSLAPQFLGRVLSTLFMPSLSHGEESRLIQSSARCVQAHAFAGTMIAIPLIVFSDMILYLAYGNRFQSGSLILVSAACLQAIFTLRAGLDVTMISKGLTWDLFMNSLCRATVFPVTLGLAAIGIPVACITIPAIVGELIAILILTRVAQKRRSLPPRNTLIPLSLLLFGIGTALALRFSVEKADIYCQVSLGLAIWIGNIVAWATTFPDITNLVRNLILRQPHQPAHEGSA